MTPSPGGDALERLSYSELPRSPSISHLKATFNPPLDKKITVDQSRLNFKYVPRLSATKPYGVLRQGGQRQQQHLRQFSPGSSGDLVIPRCRVNLAVHKVATSAQQVIRSGNLHLALARRPAGPKRTIYQIEGSQKLRSVSFPH